VPKNATRRVRQAHPGWCNRTYQEPSEHETHYSTRERVRADRNSDTVIEAYLVELTKPLTRAPLLAIEIHEPGENLAAHVLSFAQLRRLHESLGKLIQTAVPS
jgi:hypothetical protein